MKRPYGFRNYEFNLMLEKWPNVNVWTMPVTRPGADAFFTHTYGQSYKKFFKNRHAYFKFYPQDRGRIFWLCPWRQYSFKLAYSVFLCTTYTLLPFYEKNKIPFIFVLYPNGGFGLNNPSSDAMLQKVCSSPYFRGVVCTQPVIEEYLLTRHFCKKEDRVCLRLYDRYQIRPNVILSVSSLQ